MLYHSAAKLQNSLSSIVWNWTAFWMTYTADLKRDHGLILKLSIIL